MSTILRWLGLEPPVAVQARRAESQERFDEQLRERSVTNASRLHNVAVKRLDRALKAARAESDSIRRHH